MVQDAGISDTVLCVCHDLFGVPEEDTSPFVQGCIGGFRNLKLRFCYIVELEFRDGMQECFYNPQP